MLEVLAEVPTAHSWRMQLGSLVSRPIAGVCACDDYHPRSYMTKTHNLWEVHVLRVGFPLPSQ